MKYHFYNFDGSPERKAVWRKCGFKEKISVSNKWETISRELPPPSENIELVSILITILPGDDGNVDVFLDDLKALPIN